MAEADGPDDPDGNERTAWHILLGIWLAEMLGPTGIEVRTEVEVTAGIPRADILLLRRQGEVWTEEQKCLLADGLRDLSAREILIEFKFGESLSEDALSRITVYDYLYRRLNTGQPRGDLQSVIVSARKPRKPFLDRYGFRPLAWPGVFEAVPAWGGPIRLILLNQLDEQPHNAPPESVRQSGRGTAKGLCRGRGLGDHRPLGRA